MRVCVCFMESQKSKQTGQIHPHSCVLCFGSLPGTSNNPSHPILLTHYCDSFDVMATRHWWNAFKKPPLTKPKQNITMKKTIITIASLAALAGAANAQVVDVQWTVADPDSTAGNNTSTVQTVTIGGINMTQILLDDEAEDGASFQNINGTGVDFTFNWDGDYNRNAPEQYGMNPGTGGNTGIFTFSAPIKAFAFRIDDVDYAEKVTDVSFSNGIGSTMNILHDGTSPYFTGDPNTVSLDSGVSFQNSGGALDRNPDLGGTYNFYDAINGITRVEFSVEGVDVGGHNVYLGPAAATVIPEPSSTLLLGLSSLALILRRRK